MKHKNRQGERAPGKPVESGGVDLEELYCGAIDEVSKRFDRVEGYEPYIEQTLFMQCSEVARLAVELSRLAWLRDKSSNTLPADHLEEAAQLIQSSAAFIAANPQKEKKAAEERFIKKILVGMPLSDIFGKGAKGIIVELSSGKKVNFLPFSDGDPKGFHQFLDRHFRRLVNGEVNRNPSNSASSLREEVVRLLATAGLAAAKARLEESYYSCRAALLGDAAKSVGNGNGKAWAERVFGSWLELAVTAARKDFISQSEEHGISAANMQALAATRFEGNKAKGQKKSKVPTEKEETAPDAKVARKKQPTIRKKRTR